MGQNTNGFPGEPKQSNNSRRNGHREENYVHREVSGNGGVFGGSRVNELQSMRLAISRRTDRNSLALCAAAETCHHGLQNSNPLEVNNAPPQLMVERFVRRLIWVDIYCFVCP